VTSKERLLTALRGGKPDMVPVEIGTSEMWAVRNSGLNYIEFFFYEKLPLWKARLDVARRFNSDGWLHGSRGEAPDSVPITEELLLDEADRKILRQTAHTGKGKLSREIAYFSDAPVSIIRGWVNDVASDYDKALAFLVDPTSCDYSELRDMYLAAADDAMVGYWIPTPMDWWSVMRGSPQEAILDFFDYPEIMKRVYQVYTEFSEAELDFVCRNFSIDSIGLGGSCCSMSVISPDIFRDWQLDFIQRLCLVAHRYGQVVQLHMCGRSRKALEILLETDLDAVEPLERAPTGDCDLAEVKRLFGKRFSLKGNVNSIETMLNGSPEDVEREAKRCIESASAGGGYILAVGDQTPYWTPPENISALVESARKWGRYERRI